jgi:hypothetical protein
MFFLGLLLAIAAATVALAQSEVESYGPVSTSQAANPKWSNITSSIATMIPNAPSHVCNCSVYSLVTVTTYLKLSESSSVLSYPLSVAGAAQTCMAFTVTEMTTVTVRNSAAKETSYVPSSPDVYPYFVTNSATSWLNGPPPLGASLTTMSSPTVIIVSPSPDEDETLTITLISTNTHSITTSELDSVESTPASTDLESDVTITLTKTFQMTQTVTTKSSSGSLTSKEDDNTNITTYASRQNTISLTSSLHGSAMSTPSNEITEAPIVLPSGAVISGVPPFGNSSTATANSSSAYNVSASPTLDDSNTITFIGSISSSLVVCNSSAIISQTPGVTALTDSAATDFSSLELETISTNQMSSVLKISYTENTTALSASSSIWFSPGLPIEGVLSPPVSPLFSVYATSVSSQHLSVESSLSPVASSTPSLPTVGVLTPPNLPTPILSKSFSSVQEKRAGSSTTDGSSTSLPTYRAMSFAPETLATAAELASPTSRKTNGIIVANSAPIPSFQLSAVPNKTGFSTIMKRNFEVVPDELLFETVINNTPKLARVGGVNENEAV